MDARGQKRMSAVPAAQFLADFGADADAAAGPAGGINADEVSAASAAAKLEEAYGRGLLTGRAAANAQLKVKLDEQRVQFVAELAAERERWVTETGEALVNHLHAAVEQFEARVAETTARILKPFLEGALHQQAIAELQASLNVLVATDPGVSLHISGPSDVLEALRVQLADKTLAVNYVPSDDLDVKIVAGQATLETCLKSWMERLEEAMR
jgi:hypothetical protein